MHLQLLLIVVFGCFSIFADLFNDTLRTALCMLNDNQQKPSPDCYEIEDDNCLATNFKTINIVQSSEILKPPQLVCKSLESMVFSWDVTPTSNFLELYPEISHKNNIYTKPTACNQWTVNDLKPNMSYYIRLWKAWSKNDTYVLESSLPIEVTTTVSNSLLVIPTFEVVNLTATKEGFHAFVKWTPAKGMPCCYRLSAFSLNVSRHVSYVTCDLNFPPYERVIKTLEFGYLYNISVQGIVHGSNFFMQGPASSATVEVPSCLETYFDLSVCIPPKPEDVVVSYACGAESNICTVEISWSTPDLLPDEYIVFVNEYRESYEDVVANFTVPGTANSTVVNGISTGTYDVNIKAVSKAGRSPAAYVEDVIIVTGDFGGDGVIRYIAMAISIFALVVIVIIVACIVSKRQEAESLSSDNYNLYIKDHTKLKTSEVIMQRDKWEMSQECITFEDVLGEGAFGLVKKGMLEKPDGKTIEVAIKMLKPHPSSEEVRQLYQEISIMKLVGAHPNLMSMIGCVTERFEGPLLLVEYCPHGDLQSFLRKEWERLNNFFRDFNQATSAVNESDYNVFNKTYAVDTPQTFLTSNDLLSFARQITLGMEHLSKLKVLHRDLAARNVLVLHNKLVKVCDFGLSRDVYRDNVYLKQGAGKLPLRWMAPESITHQRYTIQSDVWSFGVLLWEIVTLGEYPYPEVGNADLLRFIKNGNRMQKPPHCREEVYEIMLSCWQENPKDRPTFTELKKQLETLLEGALNYIQL